MAYYVSSHISKWWMFHIICVKFHKNQWLEMKLFRTICSNVIEGSIILYILKLVRKEPIYDYFQRETTLNFTIYPQIIQQRNMCIVYTQLTCVGSSHIRDHILPIESSLHVSLTVLWGILYFVYPRSSAQLRISKGYRLSEGKDL